MFFLFMGDPNCVCSIQDGVEPFNEEEEEEEEEEDGSGWKR